MKSHAQKSRGQEKVQIETKSERLHEQKHKVKVQEKRVAEETHLVYNSLCERKQAEMSRRSGHGPKYIKVVIHHIILLLNVPAEGNIAMLTVTRL